MKKVLLLSLLVIAVSARAAVGDTFTNGNFKYTVTDADNNYVSIAAASTSISGALSIPSKVTYNGTTYTITSVANEGFKNCTQLTGEQSFPFISNVINPITSIGESAFEGCTGITSVMIRTRYVGANAYKGCKSLTTLKLGNAGTDYADGIDESAFTLCSKLTTIIVTTGSSIMSWPKALNNSTFEYKLTLQYKKTNGVIPTDFMGSGVYPQTNNVTLKSLELSSSIKTIGASAFNYCEALQYVMLNEGLETLESPLVDQPYEGHQYTTDLSSTNGCFSNCDNLSAIKIPSTVKSIGNACFKNCERLATLTFAEGSQLTEIGKEAFQNNAFTDVILPEGITTIGGDAFMQCKNLVSIRMPSTWTTVTSPNYSYHQSDGLYDGIFAECSSLKRVYIMNPTPINLGSSSNPKSHMHFRGTPTDLHIFVLLESVEAYKAYESWNTHLRFPYNEASRSSSYLSPMIPHKSVWTTFGYDDALDYSGITGLYNSSNEITAYAVTGYDNERTQTTVTALTEVPENTGVLLKGSTDAEELYPIPVHTNTSVSITNPYLIANLTPQTIPAKKGYVHYLLSSGTFYQMTTKGTFPKWKAYMEIPEKDANAKFFNLVIDETNETTALGNIVEDDHSGAPYYNIQGIRLNGTPQKPGLYVRNGKKIMIK